MKIRQHIYHPHILSTHNPPKKKEMGLEIWALSTNQSNWSFIPKGQKVQEMSVGPKGPDVSAEFFPQNQPLRVRSLSVILGSDIPILNHSSRFSVMSGSLLLSLPTANNQSQTVRLSTCNLSSKASSPMYITDLGIVMLARDSQPSKALCPMVVTDSGIVMLAKERQP